MLTANLSHLSLVYPLEILRNNHSLDLFHKIFSSSQTDRLDFLFLSAYLGARLTGRARLY